MVALSASGAGLDHRARWAQCNNALFARSRTPPIGNAMLNDELARVLVRAMELLIYPVERGAGKINAIYVEGVGIDGVKNKNRTNHFDDACFLVTVKAGKPVLVGAWKCTTQPGAHYTDPDNWLNSEGAANAEPGFHKDVWVRGVHNGNHEALVQRGGMIVVIRDRNANGRRDPGEPRRKGWFGINLHGPRGREKAVDQIGPYSAGCWVTNSMAAHREMMRVRLSDPRYQANPKFRFSAALLTYDQFVAGAKPPVVAEKGPLK